MVRRPSPVWDFMFNYETINYKTMGTIITYKNEGKNGVYAQIKLKNNDRILVSIGDNVVQIYKLDDQGLKPTDTIWGPVDIASTAEIVFDKNDGTKSLLNAVINRIIDCKSINDIQWRFVELRNKQGKSSGRGWVGFIISGLIFTNGMKISESILSDAVVLVISILAWVLYYRLLPEIKVINNYFLRGLLFAVALILVSLFLIGFFTPPYRYY